MHTRGLAAESPSPWWEHPPGSLRPEVDHSVLELVGPWYWGTHSFVLRLVVGGGVLLEPLSATLRSARFRLNAT
ncbi:hypothetical protein STRIP9103_04774 [Streptomyces ipomoeae 91-03]|uniref:DUF7586 domain-containing protein n=1 Tax=Streptomyces ipomoeae 91-03 TaxID=698759 RepID=L1KPI8_9ACTN|nr:hypothetical protein STRIP9103_04774 [Streptomyces ipomoeae 91-03]